ncbi:MAG: glutamine synthetase type III, partial [Pyramidobacter sp.]|nr:glutamine synthetase type III [Pyramidobacter sp.]
FSSALESRVVAGADVADAALAVIKDAWEESEAVRFEGNGYEPAWIEEAKRRGLPVCKNTVEALDQYLIREHRELLTGLGIMTEREIEAYHEVRLEQYCETVETELGVLRMMMYDGVLPAITKQIAREAKTFAALPECARVSAAPWERSIARLTKYKCGILENVEKLENVLASLRGKSTRDKANLLADEGSSVMAEIRRLSDEVEPLVAAELWPYPSYTDLFKIEDFQQ